MTINPLLYKALASCLFASSGTWCARTRPLALALTAYCCAVAITLTLGAAVVVLGAAGNVEYVRTQSVSVLKMIII